MEKEKEYVPFGEEWKNELMKLSKIHIISLYRMVCMERDELLYSINLPSKSNDEVIRRTAIEFIKDTDEKTALLILCDRCKQVFEMLDDEQYESMFDEWKEGTK